MKFQEPSSLLLFVLFGIFDALVYGRLTPLNKDPQNLQPEYNVHKRDEGSSQVHFDCKRCYECQCRHYHCPNFLNFFEFSSAAHECKPYGFADCSVKFQQHGGWSDWGAWSSCQGTCDNGTRTRRRHCSNPEPKNCGTRCHGHNHQTDKQCKPTGCITAASGFTNCSKLCSVSSVINTEPVLQRNTRQCSGNQTGSSEALALHCCGDLDKQLTGKGVNVMVQCDTFPQYTAVAMFQGGNVLSGSEGIFVGCLSQPEVGFQLIQQDCGRLPALVHVNTTQAQYGSPYAYFALI